MVSRPFHARVSPEHEHLLVYPCTLAPAEVNMMADTDRTARARAFTSAPLALHMYKSTMASVGVDINADSDETARARALTLCMTSNHTCDKCTWVPVGVNTRVETDGTAQTWALTIAP